MSDISGATLAEMNIFMRSSVLGMKSLQRILEATGNPLAITKLKVQDNYVNANAQIAAAKMKALGIKFVFHRDNDDEHEFIEDAIMPLHIDGYTIYDSPLNKPVYNDLFNEYHKYLNSVVIVEGYPGEKQDTAWNYVFNMDKFKNSDVITEDVKMILLSVTKRKHLYNLNASGDLSDDELNEILPSLAISEEIDEE